MNETKLNAINLLYKNRTSKPFDEQQIFGLKAQPIQVIDVSEKLPAKKFYTRFDLKNKYSVKTVNKGPSVTDYTQAPSCDIKNVLSQYSLNNMPIPVPNKEFFGKMTVSTDIGQAVIDLKDINTKFNMLPSSLRHKFKNDVVEFCNYCNSVSNTEFEQLCYEHGCSQYQKQFDSRSVHNGTLSKDETRNINEFLNPPPPVDISTGDTSAVGGQLSPVSGNEVSPQT